MVSELRGRSVMSACDGCARYCARRKFRRKAASARVRRNKVVPRKFYAFVLVGVCPLRTEAFFILLPVQRVRIVPHRTKIFL